MNKNILIGVVAFGGLVLLATLLPKDPEAVTEVVTADLSEETVSTEVLAQFPTYPQASIKSSKETSQDSAKIYYAFVLETSDPIASINDWYEEALSQNGWTIKSNKNVGGYQIIQGTKDNLYTSMQAANTTDNKVTISQQAYSIK
jgi:hypothetical protein